MTASGPAIPIGTGYIINAQTISANIQGYGQYEYKIDEGSYQESSAFNIIYGNHVLYINDLNGCGTLTVPVTMSPPAPIANTEQFFIAGETLANLEVEGENIQWYLTATGGLPILTSSILVDGVIYYASQTIMGVESTERLAIAAYQGFAVGMPDNLTDCVAIGESIGIFDLTSNNELLLNGLNPEEYTVEFTEGTINNFIPIEDPAQYSCLMPNQVITARVTKNDNSDNYSSATFILIVSTAPITNIVNSVNFLIENEGDTVIVDLTQVNPEILGSQPAEVNTITFFTADADAQAGVNAIENPENFVTQTQNIFFRIEGTSGCYSIGSFNVIVTTVPAPTGATEQTFTEGQTLADLEVEGENIQWYDNSGEGPVFPDGLDTPLPLTTPLEDGMTYYASQTINGVESTERIGVTVHFIMDINDNVLSALSYYPNPVSGVLNIENANSIDSITITTMLGQTVLSKNANSSSTQVDISSLSKGVYFVTIASGSASKTIKIIKE